jgi:hypothetical protein
MSLLREKILKIITIFVILALLPNISIGIIQGQQIKKNQNLPEINISASYDLIIITPEKFARYLNPLVEHKNNHGIKTKIVTVEDIYIQEFWNGRDDAEKVKYFIKDAKEKGDIEYVLLVGGRKNQLKKETWWVPVRYTYLIRPYGNRPEEKFLTDLYFADIYDSQGNFSSWDTDDDGIFGEWPFNSTAEDIPDLYPDVYVGRLPCRNVFEVKAIVKKIINYETQSFSDSWFKKMLVVAGDTYPKKTDYIDGEVYTQQAIELMSDFEPVKLWASEGTLKKWFGIVRQINKGCGFVFFSGHGGPHMWGTHPANDSKNWIGEFKLRHMPFLFNKNKLPVVLSGSGCFSNMFNVSLGNTEWVYLSITKKLAVQYNIPRCWGWSLTRKPNGGGIAVISSTGFSYESSDIDSKRGGCEWLDIHFFEQYGQENITILGKCWGNTITRCLENFTINWNDTSKTGDALIVKNVEQWLLIGDPSLKIGGYN